MPQYDLRKSEETNAVRVSRRLLFYRIATVVLFLIMVGAFIWFFLTASVSSQKALREAKDIRMAMKMLSIEQYSSGSSVFDPNKANGLADGVAERLAELSEADGTLRLTGWDVAENDALSFTYTKGRYVVFFNKNADPKEKDKDSSNDLSEDGSSWEVYLQLRVTDFH